MTRQTTRRNFLGLSALGLAAAVTPGELAWPAFASTGRAQETATAGSEISVWVTSGEERFAAAPKVAWRPVSQTSASDQLRLNPGTKYQPILGFGGAFTDGTCYMFNQLAPAVRESLFHELFHPSEMGLSTGRICVGASDYSTKVYSYDDGEPDPNLTRFSIEHDREYILPILRQARQSNPDLFLFSTPWSPPGWMKFNHSMLGGSMRRSYLDAYAQYYLKFLQAYAEGGVSVQALTSQNEVDTDQDGRMPACAWPQEYEIEFIRDHLGPLLEANQQPTKIWILDHNYNLWGRVVDMLGDQKLRKYTNSVAWHAYAGTPDMMSKAHDAYPDAEMHWTEGGPDYTDPAYLTDWCKWGTTFSEVLKNWCRSITSWNLALDEHGRPNLGPFPCGGVVTINSQTKEITRSGQYWAFAHYSRLVRRGARRFDSQTASADLKQVAFENPDGQRADRSAVVPLKANSLTTLAWT